MVGEAEEKVAAELQGLFYGCFPLGIRGAFGKVRGKVGLKKLIEASNGEAGVGVLHVEGHPGGPDALKGFVEGGGRFKGDLPADVGQVGKGLTSWRILLFCGLFSGDLRQEFGIALHPGKGFCKPFKGTPGVICEVSFFEPVGNPLSNTLGAQGQKGFKVRGRVGDAHGFPAEVGHPALVHGEGKGILGQPFAGLFSNVSVNPVGKEVGKAISSLLGYIVWV